MRYVSPFIDPDGELPEWLRRELEAVPEEQFASGPPTGHLRKLGISVGI